MCFFFWFCVVDWLHLVLVKSLMRQPHGFGLMTIHTRHRRNMKEMHRTVSA